VTNDVVVSAGCFINLDGKGYSDGGPGAGQGTVAGGGAGHGGLGGPGEYGNHGGPSYGSALEPTMLGSEGSRDTPGGGALRLFTPLLKLDGEITADGKSGMSREGGASGGSIWLDIDRIEGVGAITADGRQRNGQDGGGGAGGRIAVYSEDMDDFLPDRITAYGLWGGAVAGGAGTICINGTLIVDNNGRTDSGVTPLEDGWTFETLVARNRGRILVDPGATVTLASPDLAVSEDGRLTIEGSVVVAGGGDFHLVEVSDGGVLTVGGAYVMPADEVSVSGGTLVLDSSAAQTFGTMHIGPDGNVTHSVEGDADVQSDHPGRHDDRRRREDQRQRQG